MPCSRPAGPLDTPRIQVALARVLRPLVRLLLCRGITFPALCDLLRRIYVEVAERDFALPGKGQTDSRVSLLTGIHRKEVRRLRGAGGPVEPGPVAPSRTSLVLARWLASPSTTDGEGRPLALPRTAAPGTPSFEALVAAVTRDVRPRAVLDEWLDRGLVSLGPDDVVTLAETALVPPDGERQLHEFGRNLHDHAAAAVANVLAETPRFLERALHRDGLSEAVARDLERRSRDLAAEALTRANRAADAPCEPGTGGRWRWTFGLYSYVEEVPATASEAPAARPPAEAARRGAAPSR